MSPQKPLRVAVTGCNGKVGKHAVDALLAAGHEVFGIDRRPPGRDDINSIVADLTDYGQTFDALGSVGWDILGDTTDRTFDVVVHLAAVPHPRMFGNAETFANNVTAAYNVFEACRRLGLRDVVLASSETVLGVPFDDTITYLPLDEDSPRRGRNAYGLSKLLIEQIAEEYTKNDPELRVTALRLSYVQDVEEYAQYPVRRRPRLPHLGPVVLHRRPRHRHRPRKGPALPAPRLRDLPHRRFPHVSVKGELGDRTPLLSDEAAKQRLGFHPQHSWRDHVSSQS
ncbi:NAD-dependent epimerase/dehydratase family protein [Streptomyces sp. NPDC127079]|uniref:NAD-dependent epimerase/dehydratase family protein n=1 Tax=Streptomyces sp. NPDC127079 TaxID=3347132 RepID=UPI0036531ED0